MQQFKCRGWTCAGHHFSSALLKPYLDSVCNQGKKCHQFQLVWTNLHARLPLKSIHSITHTYTYCSQLGAVYMWETESHGKFIDCAPISFRKTVQRSAAANPVKQISFLSGSSSTAPIDQSASHNSAAGINKQKNVAEEINKQENAAVEINKQENAGDS